MEEKKLTDKEIVKAYEYCIANSSSCVDCPYDDWGCAVHTKDILEVVKRQKAEIERLTAEKEDLYFQNKNLQTYIDNHEPIWKRNTEQAVKDVAKEIFTDLLNEFSIRKSCGNADVVVREKAKNKGVEVE